MCLVSAGRRRGAAWGLTVSCCAVPRLIGMCGRYVSTRSSEEIASSYGATMVADLPLPPRYNIAPTTPVDVIVDRGIDRSDPPARTARIMRWGLVPNWAKDLSIGSRMINARSETVDTKPAFRQAYRRRRAIVPASGYVEWVQEDDSGRKVKQPYYLHPAAGNMLNFAGLYELWPDPTKAEDDPNRWVWSTTILTCTATGPAGEVHDRTPVILPQDRVDDWLDPARTDPEDIRVLLDGLTPPLLGVRRIPREINNVRNEGPHLIDAIEPTTKDATLQLSLVS